MALSRDYLGSGIAFPIRLERGKVAYATDTVLINQSIGIILATPVRTRFFVPEFGSRLSELLFEPNDEVLEDLLEFFIREALQEWEKRIAVVSISFERPSEEQTDCTITYRVLNSNEIDSFIYPFYRQIKY